MKRNLNDRIKEKQTLDIAIVAGGTGGHIMPALALGEALGNIGYSIEISYYCGNRSVEREIYAAGGVEPYVFPLDGMGSGNVFRRAGQILGMGRSFLRSMRLMRRHDVVVGMGGYVSAPALTAAWMAKVPIVLHESNAVLGRVNRMLAPRAKAIICGMPLVNKPEKVNPERIVELGTPVRLSVLRGDRLEAAASMFMRPDAFTLFICGGSLGARGLNNLMIRVLAALSEKWMIDRPLQIIWSTGAGNLDDVRETLKSQSIRGQFWIAPTIDRMDHAYALADLIVGRAGASFISELCLVGKPSVLIPLPNSAEHHQRHNAEYLQSRGAAEVFDQETTPPERLAEEIAALAADSKDLEKMSEFASRLAKPNAPRDIARMIVQIALGKDIVEGKRDRK